MSFIFLLLIFLYTNVISDGSVNYCGARMCANTNSHTFCRYPPGPSPSCRGYINASLSSAEKSRILERLNRRRSDIARGVRRLPTAGDMLKLRWVEELAREAQRWADQCVEPTVPEERDTCRDFYSISVGQCVASVVGEAPGLRPETMVDMWYMQSKHYKGNATSYIPPKSSFNYYGDFAQMIWSRAYMVGCGRSSFMISWHNRLRSVQRLVCNFAPRGPIPSRPLWSSAPPATACPPRSRPDDDMPELCTYHRDMDETFDEDNVMSLKEHLLINTVFEIERNISRDHIGILDEIYLTKLAVATIENTLLRTSPYNLVQKRNIDVTDTEAFTINDIGTNPNTEIFHIKLPSILRTAKKKGNFVGRPKAYKIEDLNDSTTESVIIHENPTQETGVEKYNYGDYEFDDTIYTTPLTIVTKTTTHGATFTLLMHNTSNSLWLRPDNTVKIIKQKVNTTSIPEEPTASNLVSYNKSNEGLDVYNDIITNLNITQILNKSDEDILNDPGTMRQLEEALNRMETKLANSIYTGKVRRELRSDEKSNENSPNDSNLKDSARNKSLERGPILKMVLKYLPYLKTYEKTIVGDSTSNNSASLSSSLVFLTILLL